MNSIVAEKSYISGQLGIPYQNLSQSYLRSETALTTNSTIRFELQANKKSSPLVTERLLNLNDQFVITHFTVGLKKIADDSPTDAQQLTATIYTWENISVFSGAGAVNVAAIYNGSLNFTINRRQFVPQFPMRAFRRVPQTQFGTNVGYTGSGNDTADSFDNGLLGFYPCEPTILDGRMTLDVVTELGSSITFSDASNTYYAVFEARGYLVVNAKN